MGLITNLRVPRSLQDFFMIKDRRIDPEIDEGTSKFFRKVIWILIVLNVILGSYTIYDRTVYDHTDSIDEYGICTNEI